MVNLNGKELCERKDQMSDVEYSQLFSKSKYIGVSEGCAKTQGFKLFVVAKHVDAFLTEVGVLGKLIPAKTVKDMNETQLNTYIYSREFYDYFASYLSVLHYVKDGSESGTERISSKSALNYLSAVKTHFMKLKPKHEMWEDTEWYVSYGGAPGATCRCTEH